MSDLLPEKKGIDVDASVSAGHMASVLDDIANYSEKATTMPVIPPGVLISPSVEMSPVSLYSPTQVSQSPPCVSTCACCAYFTRHVCLLHEMAKNVPPWTHLVHGFVSLTVLLCVYRVVGSTTRSLCF